MKAVGEAKRDAARDLESCEYILGVPHGPMDGAMAHIARHWINRTTQAEALAEAYRKLAEAYKLAMYWRYVDGDRVAAIEAAKVEIRKLGVKFDG